MAGYAAGNHATVGMRRPSGEYERPILGKGLFRTKPGNFFMPAQNGLCFEDIYLLAGIH